MASETTQDILNETTAAVTGFIDIDKIDTDAILGFVTVHGLKLLMAVVIFFVGKWIAKKGIAVICKAMDRAKVDPTLSAFVGNILFGIAMAFVVIAVLAQVGIQTTSLAAVIGAAGLAIGLALQGSLSNFAAGFLIILFRFFKVGDYVEIAGTGGTVEDVSIFTTTLTTPDNRRIIIPNGNITGDTIINYSSKPTRRLDLVIGVAYDADLKKTKTLLEKVLDKCEYTLKTSGYTVEVLELGASSVDFVVRPWVKTADYWSARFALMMAIKQELDKAGIGIPFPQRDVNLFIREGDIDTAKKAVSKKKAA